MKQVKLGQSIFDTDFSFSDEETKPLIVVGLTLSTQDAIKVGGLIAAGTFIGISLANFFSK